MTNTDEKIAALTAEVERLKAAQPTPFDESAAARHRDEMHRASEARMSRAVPPEVVRDWAVVPDEICRGLVRDSHAPTGHSYSGVIPSSQQVSNVRVSGGAGPPGGGGGWVREIPISPSPHQRYVDAQLDAQDAKDRQELIKQKVQEQALTKAAVSKP